MFRESGEYIPGRVPIEILLPIPERDTEVIDPREGKLLAEGMIFQSPRQSGYRYLKVITDVVLSVIVLAATAPFFILLALAIKISDGGPVLYTQERIGRMGRKFRIIKFRSMVVDAETGHPELSTENDLRVTRIGKLMRRYRLDELPNFLNVLKGDMSIVGPRPERQFYIDKIVERAPEFLYLLKIKPGITSWGQVRFGYASNVDEMLKRLKHDIVYIETISAWEDLRILGLTVITILKGRGI